MALDPHPDREPGMDARVAGVFGPGIPLELGKGTDGMWRALGFPTPGLSWPELVRQFPDGTVVLP